VRIFKLGVVVCALLIPTVTILKAADDPQSPEKKVAESTNDKVVSQTQASDDANPVSKPADEQAAPQKPQEVTSANNTSDENDANALSGAQPTSAQPPQAPRPRVLRAEVPGVTYGFDERFRFEGYNNADFNEEKHDRSNLIRTRLRPYADVNFGEYLEGYVRMGWEGMKRFSDASYPVPAGAGESGSPFTAGELWFDNAYLLLKKVPKVDSLSLQAGRFDIAKGDGWLFSDPSGLDGSRSGYDNAFDLAYRRKNSRLEVMGIDNPKYDEFFPVWNKQPIVDPTNPCNSGTAKNYEADLAQTGKQLQEWSQEAIGVYYTNRDLTNSDFEAYTFFNKSYGDLRKPTYYLYLPDRHYAILGGRGVHRLQRVKGLSVTGEFAYEAGTEDRMNAGTPNFDLRAWGGFGYAKQRFNVWFKPYVTAGFWALSGQDPKSRTVGNFDPLFQRSTNMSLTGGDAPSWSEFYVYSYGYEEGSYYWTNLKMAQAEAGFTPVKWVTLVGGYAHMDSMYPYAVNPYHSAGSVSPASPAAGVFGAGTGRGQLAKARAIYTLFPGVQGYYQSREVFPWRLLRAAGQRILVPRGNRVEIQGLLGI
jgi:hypothetical protein